MCVCVCVFLVISDRHDMISLSFLPKTPAMGPGTEGQAGSGSPEATLHKTLPLPRPSARPSRFLPLAAPLSHSGPATPEAPPPSGPLPGSKMAPAASALGEVSSHHSGREGGAQARGWMTPRGAVGGAAALAAVFTLRAGARAWDSLASRSRSRAQHRAGWRKAPRAARLWRKERRPWEPVSRPRRSPSSTRLLLLGCAGGALSGSRAAAGTA